MKNATVRAARQRQTRLASRIRKEETGDAISSDSEEESSISSDLSGQSICN